MTSKTVISQKLKHLTDNNRSDSYTIEKLINQLGENAYFLIVLILSVPFLQPIPLPGLSSLFGFIMSILGIAIMFNIAVPHPKFIVEKKLPVNLLQIIFNTLSFILSKFEYLIRPRFPKLVDHHATRFFCGIAIFISALILLLPLPPGMNFPPAVVCFILALGLLEKDLYIIILGLFIFIFEAVMSILLAEWVYKWIMEFINKYF